MTIRISTHKQSTIEAMADDDVVTIDISIDCINDSNIANVTVAKQSERNVVKTYKCTRDDILDAIKIVTQQYHRSYYATATNYLTNEVTRINFERVDDDHYQTQIDFDITLDMTRDQLLSFGRCFTHGC